MIMYSNLFDMYFLINNDRAIIINLTIKLCK